MHKLFKGRKLILFNYVFQKSTLIITDVAVPLFFIISGVLLFSGYQITNYSSLVRKKLKQFFFHI